MASPVRVSAPARSLRDLVSLVDTRDGLALAVPLGHLPAELPGALRDELEAFRADVDHPGTAGTVRTLHRPGRTPRVVYLVGIGDGDEAGWRTAGGALVRAAGREPSLTVLGGAGAVRGLAEGLLLGAYRYRLGQDVSETRLASVGIVAPGAAEALAEARTAAEVTCFARDLVHTPGAVKSPEWFAAEVTRYAAGTPGLTVTVRDPDALAAEGFGGLLAVGGGSVRGPRLVEVSWQPPTGEEHVVLVGKGITFDTGGLDLKTRDGMKLMRKDMAGAAAVTAAAIGAAALGLPVRVTALAPLAENMPSGAAYRPGDIVRHYGGLTSEVGNTDAEGRVVLGDALAYAVTRLAPDVLVDLATLTGAASVALGKRTAALYTENDALAGALRTAAEAAGERVWRMPLPDDYREVIEGELADLTNSPRRGGASSVAAALYLREFTGTAHGIWAHLDMSAPAWADSTDGELVKGATGWGVRTLLRWLASPRKCG
jgi:leucyl aminopeptidase